tara:strand:+ start:756 stop:917 length:162 start_codon:yes stop_codon:yes gene_type:complete
MALKFKTFFGKTAQKTDDKIRLAGYSPIRTTYRKMSSGVVSMRGVKSNIRRKK